MDQTLHDLARDPAGETAHLLANVLERLHDGVIAEHHGRVAVTNRSARSLLRLDHRHPASDPDAMDRHIATLARDGAGFLAGTRRARSAPVDTWGETIPLRDGRVLERDSAPLDPGRADAGRLWVYRDATARLSAERRLGSARDEAVATADATVEHLSTVSHEIRTPMNGVIGLLDLLGERELDHETSALVTMLQGSASQLLRVVDDALQTSRPDADGPTIDERPFRPEEVLREAVGLFHGSAERKGVELTSDVDPSLSGRFVGDAGRLRQIACNVIDNAIKFTDDGSVHVEARGGHRDGGCILDVSVRDSGRGVDPHLIPELFEPFGRAHGDVEGSGLGLAISRRLAERMGGSLTMDSEPGRGTVVRLTLPLADAPDAPPAAPKARPGALGLHVLVAEDDAVTQVVLVRQLHALGCTVEVVGDGRSAVRRALAGGTVDVVLMDLELPELDGLRATRGIRHANAAMSLVPILGLTARATDADRDRCLEGGMDAHLAKPVRREGLRQALERLAAEPEIADELDAVTTRRLIEDFGDDRAAVVEVLEIYRAHLDDRVRSLCTTAAEGAPRALASKAHALRSPSATVGATDMATLCRRIEDACVRHEPASCRALARSVAASRAPLDRTLLARIAELTADRA